MISRNTSSMHNLRSRSSGMGIIGILVSLLAIVSVITLTLKLGPHYIDWRTMQSVFTGLERQSVHEMNKDQIREAIAKGFRINGLRDFDQRALVTIEVEAAYTDLLVSYERREHIALNADVVLTFSQTFRYP